MRNKIRKIIYDIVSSCRTWQLFNYIWIRPPEFIIDILNSLKRILNLNKERVIITKNLSYNNSKYCFQIDSKYEWRIDQFFKTIKFTKLNNNGDIYVTIWWIDTPFINNTEIFLDLSDESKLNQQYEKTKYIKRECLKNYLDKIIPLPYLFCDNYIKTKEINKNINKEEKEHFITFWWQIKSANNNRKIYISKLKKHFWNKFYLCWLPFEKYINALNRSKYSINLFWQWEYCCRFQEIANCNTLMLCQKYNIVIPNDFTDMENIVYFESFEELIKKIEILENNPKLYDKILNWFKNHYQKYHTHEKYCDKLIELIMTP